MRSAVVFCGREFRSASVHVSKLLAARRPDITIRVIEQKDVEAALCDTSFDRIVAVPLMSRLDGALIRKAKNLKFIQQWGVGLEGVDIKAASERGIPVANTSSNEWTAQSTAEQAIRLLLNAGRSSFGHPSSQSGNENWGDPRGTLLKQKHIGVVGYRGAVGSIITRILQDGFGAHVTGIGRSNVALKDVVQSLPQKLDGLITVSPLTPSTQGMVCDEVFNGLQKGALVVNVGRGPLVDRKALERALENDNDLRFATDVWWEEPPDFKNDLLLRHPRVIVSPHIGGMTKEGSRITDERCSEGILNFLDGRVPSFVVNASGLKSDTSSSTVGPVRPLNNEKSDDLPHAYSQVHPPSLPRPSKEATNALIQDLLRVFPKTKLTTNPVELQRRGSDESLHEGVAPDVCVMPESTEEVSQILQICSRHRYPVVPFGRGTSLEGHVAALSGGLSIDLSGMNKIVAVSARDFECLVQAGVSRLQLNQELRSTGLFFPVDPGADATLGGMSSTRASGTTAVRYGTMRDRVMGLTVVLPSGEIIRTGSRALKSSAGYDLTGLFVGSEGTLGVITEVRLKLAPIPEAVCAAVAQFRTVESAVNTVIELKQLGVPVARAEFLDATTMRAVRAAGLHGSGGQEDRPSLFLEFHGSQNTASEQSALAQSVAGDDLVSYHEATLEEERNRLWKARHNAFYSVMKLRPAGTKGWPTDVCVPVTRLAECITETIRDVEQTGIIAPVFGHIGDGNFHCILLHNQELDGDDGLRVLQRFNERIVNRALKMEGTCTGEHGVGYGKKSWLLVEHGPEAVQLMRQLKRAVDPHGIMNPGKIF